MYTMSFLLSADIKCLNGLNVHIESSHSVGSVITLVNWIIWSGRMTVELYKESSYVRLVCHLPAVLWSAPSSEATNLLIPLSQFSLVSKADAIAVNYCLPMYISSSN